MSCCFQASAVGSRLGRRARGRPTRAAVSRDAPCTRSYRKSSPHRATARESP